MADNLSHLHAMTVELVHTTDGLQQLGAEWRRLEAEVGLLPFVFDLLERALGRLLGGNELFTSFFKLPLIALALA